ncbi:hypothetical protein M8C21_018786 [Ambrosia artemisiifolia]|uniref:PLAC8 family protein n=1 Tax=Ambrosia artemisiifolia TaxID=4212 RepID=A0AAD5CI23_AMBAR|nr:hypothetical protein M8C21_018786 [Ambrosia artemisiifolia]
MTKAKEQVNKMKHRKSYRFLWHTTLINTICADTPYCCFALFCGPCASYKLRKRALYGDMSRYTCCGGYMPCSGKCGERKCPKFCLCTEVLFCFGTSVASTRFMLQDELNIQTTKCDNCIIGCMVCLQQVACIFSIAACIFRSDELKEASQILNCLADLVFCSVCSCMQTQHKVEMDKRDGKFGTLPMEVPPVQKMSRIDQPAYVPPSVQYGQPQYVQGYPPSTYPPQYVQGYPPMYPTQPQGYPPATYPPPYQGYPPGVYPPPQQGYPSAPYPSQPHPPPQPHVQGYPPPGQYK